MLVDWAVHLSMTKGDCRSCGWASYSTFKKYFNRYEWDENPIIDGSYWNRKIDCKYHANIIKFEGMGMLINNPISLSLVKNFVRKAAPRKSKVDFKSGFMASNRNTKSGYDVKMWDGTTIYVSKEEMYKER